MINTDVLPHLLTIDELAEHLGVTVRHVRRQIAERRVPYIKVGRLVRFDPDEISEWINEGRRPQDHSVGRPRPGHPLSEPRTLRTA